MRIVRTFALVFMLAATAAAQPVNLAGSWKISPNDSPKAARPETDDAGWRTVKLPQRTPRTDSSYWLRRTVPAPDSASDLAVTVGLLSESYDLYANGVRIGGTGDLGQRDVHFFQPRVFRLPAELLQPAKPLTIALHIWNTNAQWGSLTTGLQDHGPYWITTAEHARAEVDAARLGLRLDLIMPAWIALAVQAGFGLCLLILWFSEKERRELLWFAAYLALTGLGSLLGLWVAFTGASSFWYRLGFRPVFVLGFLFLVLAATLFLRLRAFPAPLLAAVTLLSLAIAFSTVYYLYPALALLAWQCVQALRSSPRRNLPFVVPLSIYAAGIVNNTLPRNVRVLPATIDAAGMSLSVTNLIQLLFAGAMLILMLRRLTADRREKLRMASEFEAARTIQQLLLSGVAEPSKDYIVKPVYRPAQEVGGDLFYVLPDEGGAFAVVVADVSGKGLKAALQVSLIVGALRETHERHPGPILTALNNVAMGQTGGGFITCC